MLSIKPLNHLIHQQLLMSQPQYLQSPYRFLIFISFLLALFAGLLPQNIFASISTLVQDKFQLPALIVTINYLSGVLLHFIFLVPINWFITKKGVKITILTSSACGIAGAWLKTTLSTSNPYLCILGSFLSAFSIISIASCTTKIVVTWFRAQIFSSIVFVAAVFNSLALSGGLILPGFVLKSTSNQQDIINFLRIMALVVTAPSILLALVIRQRPQHPPSKSAQLQQKVQQKHYLKNLKSLFKNSNYVRLIVAGCFNTGPVIIFLSILSDYLTGLDYIEAGQVIAKSDIFSVCFGIVGNLFFGAMVKKTKKYKILTIVLAACVVLGFALMNFGFIEGFTQTWQIMITASLFGFSYYAHNGMFNSFSAQIAFPIDQVSIIGYLNGFIQTFGSILSFIFVPLVRKTRDNSILLVSIISVLQVIGLILMFFVRQDLRKDNYESGEVKKESFLKQEEQKEETHQPDCSDKNLLNYEQDIGLPLL